MHSLLTAAIAILTCLAAATTLVEPARIIDVAVPTRYLAGDEAVTIVLPEGYSADDSDPYPVLYLLNGHGGNNRSWSTITRLDSLATEYDMIIVCPDGRNSWYWDSPVNDSLQMESFIINDLIPYIDSRYNTRTDRLGRAVSGLSMGGHGALWLAMRHQNVFGSAGSTSGGVDITPFPSRWNMKDALGLQKENPRRWRDHSVMTVADTLSPGRLNIIFDCGTSDFFFKVNNRLDSLWRAHGVEHTYLTSPGAHTPAYWRRSIEPQLTFFNTIFNQ